MTAKKGKSNGRTTKKTGVTKSESAKAVGTSGGSAESRSSRRVPIQLLVDYKAGGNYLFDFCRDLGSGGVFIETTAPLPTGASIDLTFTIPDSKETLVTKGTVIWVQAPVQDRKDLTPGMGVQFAAFSVEQRKILEEFVVRYHGQRLNAAPSKRVG